MAAGRRFHNFLKMTHHVLPVMRHASRSYCSGISGFQRPDSQIAAKLQCRIELAFIHRNIAAGFVMRDEFNFSFFGVAYHCGQIEIRIRLAEILHRQRVRSPCFPSLIPAFGQKAANAVTGAKVNVVFGPFGGGSMCGSGIPGVFSGVHAPPYSGEFHGFDPRHVFDCARLVEILNQMRFHQLAGIAGDHDCAPGCCERRFCPDTDAIGPGPQMRMEQQRIGLVAHEHHFGIIQQSCFVDANAVTGSHNRQGCVGIVDFRKRRIAVQRFVGKFIGWNPPGTVVAGKAKFSVFGCYQETVVRFFGKNIPEGHAIVVHPEFDVEPPVCRIGFFKIKNGGIEIIPDRRRSSPNGFPCFVGRRTAYIIPGQIGVNGSLISEFKSHGR